jgi:hypothetical protein
VAAFAAVVGLGAPVVDGVAGCAGPGAAARLDVVAEGRVAEGRAVAEGRVVAVACRPPSAVTTEGAIVVAACAVGPVVVITRAVDRAAPHDANADTAASPPAVVAYTGVMAVRTVCCAGTGTAPGAGWGGAMTNGCASAVSARGSATGATVTGGAAPAGPWGTGDPSRASCRATE